MKVEQNRVLISGGASGLGEACARFFANKQAKVFITDLNENKGQALAQEIGAEFQKTDVCVESQCEKVLAQVVEKFQGLDVLVNCAGLAPAQRLLNKTGEPHSLEIFQKVLSVNLVGTFNMARLAAQVMAKNEVNDEKERGVIINTASIAAFEGQIGQVAYAASKGAIVSMTLPMARDLATVGIRVCTVAPGIFATPLLAGLPKNVRESLGQSIPFPSRLGRPDEFASTVAHIVENTVLNGETIRLDGALRMQPR